MLFLNPHPGFQQEGGVETKLVYLSFFSVLSNIFIGRRYAETINTHRMIRIFIYHNKLYREMHTRTAMACDLYRLNNTNPLFPRINSNGYFDMEKSSNNTIANCTSETLTPYWSLPYEN